MVSIQGRKERIILTASAPGYKVDFNAAVNRLIALFVLIGGLVFSRSRTFLGTRAPK